MKKFFKENKNPRTLVKEDHRLIIRYLTLDTPFEMRRRREGHLFETHHRRGLQLLGMSSIIRQSGKWKVVILLR